MKQKVGRKSVEDSPHNPRSLIEEGGHGVVGTGAFHPEGFHLLLGGFADLLQAVVRPLPFVHLHHLSYLLQSLLLCAQSLTHNAQASAPTRDFARGELTTHTINMKRSFGTICYFLTGLPFVMKRSHAQSCKFPFKPCKVSLKTIHLFQLFFLFGFVLLVAAVFVPPPVLFLLLLLVLHLFQVHLEKKILQKPNTAHQTLKKTHSSLNGAFNYIRPSFFNFSSKRNFLVLIGNKMLLMLASTA